MRPLAPLPPCRLRSDLLLLLLSFAAVFVVVASPGAARASVVVSVVAANPEREVEVGDEVEIQLRVAADQPLLGWGLDLVFDRTQFEALAPPVVGPLWTGVAAADGDGLAALAFPIGISGSDLLLASVRLRVLRAGVGRIAASFDASDLAEGFPLDPSGFDLDVRFEGLDLRVIPEPGSALLLLLGLAGLGRRRSRGRRSAVHLGLGPCVVAIGALASGGGSAQTFEDFDATFPPDLYYSSPVQYETVIQPQQRGCLVGGAIECFIDSYNFEMSVPSMVWDGGPRPCRISIWHLGVARPNPFRSLPMVAQSDVYTPPIETQTDRRRSNRWNLGLAGFINLVDHTDPFTAGVLNMDYDRIFAAASATQAGDKRWVFWQKHESGCTDSLPIVSPSSRFEWESLGGQTIRFDASPSYPGSSNVHTYLWNFGDGSPVIVVDEPVVEHRYPNAGAYRVLLRVTNRNSAQDDFFDQVWADDGVAIEIETPTPEYAVGTDSTATIRVRTTLEADQHLVFDAPLLRSTDATVVTPLPVDPPEGIVVSAATGPYSLSVPIRAAKGGTANLIASLTATDAETGAQVPATGFETVVVDPFEVTVTASPSQFLVNETPLDELDPECRRYNDEVAAPDPAKPTVANCIAVTAVVKNVSDTTVEGVEMLDAMNLSGPGIKSLDPDVLDVPLVDVTFVPDPENPASGDLAPQQSAEFTWLLRANGGSPNLEITAIAVGTLDGIGVRGSGTGRLKLVENRILRFGVKEKDPGRPRVSGSPVRLEGFLENLSSVSHIGVTIFPIVEENAGRGILWDVRQGIPPVTERAFNDDVNSACRHFAEVEADRLLAFPKGFVLPPRDPDASEGSKIELAGVLATLCWDDLSIAKVRYVAEAYTLDTDEDGNLLNEAGAPMALDEMGIPRPGQGAPRRLDRLVSQLEYVEEAPYQRQIVAFLRENPDLAQDVLSECGYQTWPISIACEGGRGVYSLGYGLIQMPPMLWQATKSVVLDDIDYGVRLGHWTAEQWSNMYRAWVENDPDAYRKLVDEAKLLTDSLVLAAVITADQQETLVVKAANEIGKIATDYEKGNYEKLAGRLAFVAGENADALVSGALARALAAKVHRARYLTRADEVDEVTNSVKEAVEQISDEVDEIKTSDRFRQAEAADPDVDITTAGVAKANDPLSYHAIERWVGVGRDTVRKIEEICDRFGITVAFRSRGVGAIAKLKQGLAYLKPQSMKIKNTNELDIKYLGYPPEAKDVVVFIEPPIAPPAAVNRSRKGWANEKAMTDALDDYMTNTLGKSKPPGLDEVDSRIAAATFDRRIDLEIDDFEFSSNAADEYFQIRERLRLRMQEWDEFSKADKLGTPDAPGDWAVNGIPLAFGYKANGLGAILDKLPKLKGQRRTMVVEEGFRVLDEAGDVNFVVTDIGTNAQGVKRKILNVAMDGPKGLRPFTGDIDFLHILDSTGGIIRNPVRRFFIYLALANEVGMQHGESFTFALGKLTTRARYLNKHLAGKKGAEFLTTVSPGRVKRVGFYAGARAVVSDLGNGIRQFSPGHHFVPVTSLSQTLRSQADILKRIYKPRTWTEVTQDFFVQAARWLAPLKTLSENTKRVNAAQVATSFSGNPDDPSAQVPQPLENGELGVLRPATSQSQAEAAHAVGHGEGPPIPQVALEWQAIDVADATGSNGLIDSLPISAITNFPEAGSDTLEVVGLEDLEMPLDSAFFEAGQYVAINPTRETQEINRIYSVEPLILEKPLVFDHEPGEIVTVLPTAFVPDGCVDCGHAAGDLDRDGDVDEDDRARFFAAFGSTSGTSQFDERADLDRDGAITFVDYQLWLDSYREAQDPDPVPEPNPQLLLLIGLAALIFAARRRPAWERPPGHPKRPQARPRLHGAPPRLVRQDRNDPQAIRNARKPVPGCTAPRRASSVKIGTTPRPSETPASPSPVARRPAAPRPSR